MNVKSLSESVQHSAVVLALIANAAATINNLNTEYVKEYCSDAASTCIPWDNMSPEAQTGWYGIIMGAMANPAKTPLEQHDNWVNYKLASGWKYGPVASAELKEHPNMVHWDELLPEEQFKDVIFQTVVYSTYREILKRTSM